jgi:hypothetical protein
VRGQSEMRMARDERSVSRYVVSGDEADGWLLTSTSANGQPKHNLNLEGDDVLLEFLRGVIAKGGRVIVELPGSGCADPERAGLGHQPEPKRCKKK